METKPLGKKSYGSIGHLPGSRVGPGDHHIDPKQARCMTTELAKPTRIVSDRIIVQEKLDGTNVGVCKVDGRIIPLVRAGWDAWSSPRLMHRMFAHWVRQREDMFRDLLADRERVCGEWLALAHGTKYALAHNNVFGGTRNDPFVAFDIFSADDIRLPFDVFYGRNRGRLATPHVFHAGGEPFPIDRIADLRSHHGAIDPMEGVVYRWERTERGVTRVLMLAKYVSPGKVDGCYLGDNVPPIWNWLPVDGPGPAAQ